MIFFLQCNCILAQKNQLSEPGLWIQNNIEELTESLTSTDENTDETESALTYFLQHPININYVDDETLQKLNILSPIQLSSFFEYRRLLGPFIDIHELQSIPFWNLSVIQKILPYLVCNNHKFSVDALLKRIKNGHHLLLLRYSQALTIPKGYDAINSEQPYYVGPPFRLSLKYQYQHTKFFKGIFLADKDPGEPFFGRSQPAGFDFYAGSISIQQLGCIQSILLGDYTVNIGQGLIQWQDFGVKKSSNLLSIKRSGQDIRPYTSFNENNFHRGAAVSLTYKSYNLTCWGSRKKMDSNIYVDSITDKQFVTSFITDGLHQTASELDKKNNCTLMEWGASAKKYFSNGDVSIHFLRHSFDIPIQKSATLYNTFAFYGKNITNASLSYEFSKKNFHFFGETAYSDNNAWASINGAFIAVSKNVDMALLYRDVSRKYISLSASAITENTIPQNENGFFIGLQSQLHKSLQVTMYADFFSFPWIKYQVNEPSTGQEYFIQLSYQPSKKIEWLLRYKSQLHQENVNSFETPIFAIQNVYIQSIKSKWALKISNQFLFASNLEILKILKEGNKTEEGFLFGSNLSFHAFFFPIKATIGGAYFESDSYASRVYFSESDVSNITTIGLYDKGFRGYVVMNMNLANNVKFSVKYNITYYPNKISIGEGNSQIIGNKMTECKAQLICTF